MTSARELLIWMVAALAACALLAGLLVREHRSAQLRGGSFLVGNPHVGAQLFEKKGCVHCHAVNGWGGRLAPDLGFERPVRSSRSQLVAAMWNCAPRMWERMRVEGIRYPAMDQEDMSHLFAFLYISRYLDEPGDAARGQKLLEAKGCLRCHAVRGSGGTVGPDFSQIGDRDTPIVWAQAMWNHAPAMEEKSRRLGVAWPKFEGAEMNDLLAYIRELAAGARRESQLLPASPDRGRELFRTKTCPACHSVERLRDRGGPQPGGHLKLSLSLIRFGGLMWNHSPEMWRARPAPSLPRPTFDGREMADLMAFVDTLRYFEPLGAPQAGERLFGARGCGHCHGSRAEGTRQGPALRKPGRPFTSLGLAAGLWVHGPKMYRHTQKLGVRWPTLEESDVGDLVAFLSNP